MNERFAYVQQTLAPLLKEILSEDVAGIVPRFQVSVQVRDDSPNAKVKLVSRRNFALVLTPSVRQTILDKVMALLSPCAYSAIVHARPQREVISEISLSLLEDNLLAGECVTTFSWLVNLKSGLTITQVKSSTSDIFAKTCEVMRECVSNFLNGANNNYGMDLSLFIRNGTFSSYRLRKTQLDLSEAEQKVDFYWRNLLETLFEDDIVGQGELEVNLDTRGLTECRYVSHQETKILEDLEIEVNAGKDRRVHNLVKRKKA